jgi:hypothetical protein
MFLSIQSEKLIRPDLQSLHPTFMIRCCGGAFLAAVQILAVRFPDLCYFLPQLGDTIFDGLLHGCRLAEQVALRANANE